LAAKIFAVFKKKALSYDRLTGRLDPDAAALAYASIDLAALEYQARRGALILGFFTQPLELVH